VTRRRSCGLSTAFTTTACLILFAANALAATPKTLVDPTRQTVGRLKLDQSAIRFSLAWGPPTYGQPSVAGVVPESLQMWRAAGALPWAIVTFSADDQQHATAILFRHPFRTPRGDVNGTARGLVEKHWPTHGPAEQYLPSPSLTPAYTRMKVEGSYFFFNAKNQLVAIQVGSGTAGQWINWRR
jgi:hypothetical protein